ncbi:hypothetical protein LUZ63_004821 [Rhynchospora breviuscula]|uniref:BHLH domain-containing protein n=1 Tax=Rhynchospora breviuscula TaxID=2022672 RepID=A0A9Q0CLQ3_9POAL|nr:hypothetical protein LUZ63_004821 [Rhynchospora breviuscula]
MLMTTRGRKRRIAVTATGGRKRSIKEDGDGGRQKRTSLAKPSGALCFSEMEIGPIGGGKQDKSGNPEAARRNKMKDFYSALHTFLPHLPPKIGRAELAEETVNYIKVLEHRCQALEKRKRDLTESTNPYQNPPSGAASSPVSLEHYMSRNTFLADQRCKITFQPGVPKSAHQQCFTLQTSASPNVVLNVAGPDAHVSVCAPKTPELISATVYFLEKHGAEVLSVQVCSDMSRTMFVMHAHMSGFDDSMLAKERFELAKEELILWLGSSE